jgi:hypothetical protein
MLSCQGFEQEAPLADFNNTKEVRAWLKPRPRQVSVALGARMGLRILPVLQIASRNKRDTSDLVLPAFHAAAVSWAAAKYPAHKAELATRAEQAEAAFSDPTKLTDLSAPTLWVPAGFIAAVDTIFVRGAFSARAAWVTHAANRTGAADATFWSAVSADATRVEEGAATSDIAGSPLWPTGQPEQLNSIWQEMKGALLAANEDREVWTDWYEDRLAGRVQEEERELAYARIENDLWNQGPAIVNAEIKRQIGSLAI